MKYFIMIIIALFVFSCTVNEHTALIRIENTGNTDASVIKVGDTVIALYLARGAVYDYWTATEFSGIVNVSGIASAYNFDLELTVKPQWAYDLFIYTDSEGNDVWSLSADKAGDGTEDESEVKKFK